MAKRKQKKAVNEAKEARKIFRVIAYSTLILLLLLFVMYQVTS